MHRVQQGSKSKDANQLQSLGELGRGEGEILAECEQNKQWERVRTPDILLRSLSWSVKLAKTLTWNIHPNHRNSIWQQQNEWYGARQWPSL